MGLGFRDGTLFHLFSYWDIWGLSKIRDTFLGGPHNQDYSILESILGSPYFGKPLYLKSGIWERVFILGGGDYQNSEQILRFRQQRAADDSLGHAMMVMHVASSCDRQTGCHLIALL